MALSLFTSFKSDNFGLYTKVFRSTCTLCYISNIMPSFDDDNIIIQEIEPNYFCECMNHDVAITYPTYTKSDYDNNKDEGETLFKKIYLVIQPGV